MNAAFVFTEDKYLGQSGGIEAVRNENTRIAEEIQLLDQEMVRDSICIHVQWIFCFSAPIPASLLVLFFQ